MNEDRTSNYSVDMLKRAAFVAEISDIESALSSRNTEYDVELRLVVEYMKNRISQLEAKYKKAS